MRPLQTGRSVATLLACVAFGASCVGEEYAVGSATEIPGPGPWRLVWRLEDGVLLAAGPRGSDPDEGRRHADAVRVPILRWRAEESARLDTAGVVRLALPGTPVGEVAVMGRWEHEGEAVAFGIPGRSPPLLPLRRTDAAGVLEAAGTLWLVEPTGRVSRLVADSAEGYDRVELARRQREGEVILYWATSPAPDPAGERVAYATNREAVRSGDRGQSVWLVDVSSGEEHPLAVEPGASFRPEGWLGGEVVVIGSFPGVRAVDAATGRIRVLSGGTLLDVADDGSALVVAGGVPDSTRLRILGTDGELLDLSPPPAGMIYVPQAAFAPDARRLLVQAATPDGVNRRFGVVDRGRMAVHWIDPPVPPTALDSWPAWLGPQALLFTAAGSGGTSWAVPVP